MQREVCQLLGPRDWFKVEFRGLDGAGIRKFDGGYKRSCDRELRNTVLTNTNPLGEDIQIKVWR